MTISLVVETLVFREDEPRRSMKPATAAEEPIHHRIISKLCCVIRLDDGICCCLVQIREEKEHAPGERRINCHKSSRVVIFR